MHGTGLYVEVDGSRYEGGWYRGKMQGRGVQVFSKGDRYEGEYKDGHRHGHGKQTFANGNRYEGEFFQGKIQGQGTYTCTDGRIYAGSFLDNKKHGRGKYSGGQGTYEGEYVSGKKQGRGIFTWNDGSSYDGEWSDDLMHGKGVKTSSDGRISNVSYNMGKLQESQAPSERKKPPVPKRGGAKPGRVGRSVAESGAGIQSESTFDKASRPPSIGSSPSKQPSGEIEINHDIEFRCIPYEIMHPLRPRARACIQVMVLDQVESTPEVVCNRMPLTVWSSHHLLKRPLLMGGGGKMDPPHTWNLGMMTFR
jgi:hypothetical protein